MVNAISEAWNVIRRCRDVVACWLLRDDQGPAGALPSPNCDLDNIRDGFGVLMLPCPYDGPSAFSESFVELPIAGDVSFQFRKPVVDIPRRRLGMIRALVPIAAIDKYRDFRPRKYNIGLPASRR